MSTPLDRYFETLNLAEVDASKLDELAEIFTEEAEFHHSGEIARSSGTIIEWHKAQAAQKKQSKFHWTASVNHSGTIVGQWSEAGLLVINRTFSHNGEVMAELDEDGRIARLHRALAISGPDKWRAQVGKHLDVLLTTDPKARLKRMEEIYAEDIKFMEGEDVYVGRQAMSDYIGRVQEISPLRGIVVHSVLKNHQYLMYNWTFMNRSGESSSGIEVLRFNGELADEIFFFSGTFDEVLAHRNMQEFSAAGLVFQEL